MTEPRLLRVLRTLAVASAVWYLAAYVVIALLRMTYPYDLEWMEGGSVDHVVRVLRGQPLYVAPGAVFIPYEYPPLYFYVAAVMAKLVGVGFFPLRLVSFVASLASFACVYQLVVEETGERSAAFLATGLFAATFRAGGAWFDLARVDSLFLALFLSALTLLRRDGGRVRHAAAGCLLALSFFTKQPALAMALPVVLYLAYARGRRGLWLAGTLTAGVVLPSVVAHRVSGGWFTFYVWEFPFRHAFASSVWVTFWTHDMLGAAPCAFVGGCGLLVYLLRRHPERGLFWTAAFAGMVGAAFRSRLQTGGYDNVLIPAYAVLAILSGMLVATIAGRVRLVPALRRRHAATATMLACVLQFVMLVYDPRPQLPRAADREAGATLMTVIASFPGEVLLPYHGYLTTAAGKGANAHLMQVYDILKGGDDRSVALAAQFHTAIRNASYGAIILDDPDNYYFKADVDAAYVRQATVWSDASSFFPVTGGISMRPNFVYVPKPRQPAAAGDQAQVAIEEALRRGRGVFDGGPRVLK